MQKSARAVISACQADETVHALHGLEDEAGVFGCRVLSCGPEGGEARD